MDKWLSRTEQILFTLLALWLVAAALVVDTEYYDGWDSICNAFYGLGLAPEYTATRGPLMGWLLLPSAWISDLLGLHPLNPRSFHFTTALLHLLYVFGAYHVAVRLCGRSIPLLVAFAVSVPCFVFLSYAPFVSHDILPGVFFLGMLYCADRFHHSGAKRYLAALMVMGALAASIKHIYGMFWVIVLVIYAVRVWSLSGGLSLGRRFMRWVWMGGAAAGSGMLVWIALAISLRSVFVEEPFFLRPLEQLRYLTFFAHDQSRVEPWWVYLRNAPSFGWMSVFLILPGLGMAWQRKGVLRTIAFAWLTGMVLMHLVELRQVRYLLFLSPLTAVLVSLPLQRMWVRKPLRHVAVGFALLPCLPFVPWSPVREAAHTFSAFHRTSEFRTLLKPMEVEPGKLLPPVFVNWRMLSSLPPRNTPLPGDIYHDLFHLGRHHLQVLYRLRARDIRDFAKVPVEEYLPWPVGSWWIHANGPMVINHTTWRRQPAENRDTLVQTVMRHAVIPVLPDGTLPEGRKVEIVPALVQDMAGLHVRDADLKRRLSESLLWLVRAGASPDGALLQGGIDGDVVTVRGLGMDRAITGEPLFTIEALEPIFLHRTRMPEAVP